MWQVAMPFNQPVDWLPQEIEFLIVGSNRGPNGPTGIGLALLKSTPFTVPQRSNNLY